MDEYRVRIRDIAQELGLSTATVSNVIHGKTKKVSEETVKRVQEQLERRQYIPNMAGILLAQNNSKIIGVVINDHEKYEGHVLEDGFIATSLNALAKEVDRIGYFLMPKITSSWQEIPQFASMWNMVGLVLIGYCNQDYQHLRDEIRVPLVIYDGTIRDGKRLANLTIDNYGGGCQMGKHFQSLGHEQVLYIADNDTHVDHLRYEGLRSVISQSKQMLVPMEQEKRRAFYEERIVEIAQFTAVFAASDYYAADFLYFARSKGIAIPEEMSIAGFDDSFLSRQIHPMLTTIGQDHTARAKLAVELLIKLREQEPVEPEILLPVKLIQRNSTGPARTKSLSKKGSVKFPLPSPSSAPL